eukprot:1160237-Pelagomonas_calceolata.AAC.3
MSSKTGQLTPSESEYTDTSVYTRCCNIVAAVLLDACLAVPYGSVKKIETQPIEGQSGAVQGALLITGDLQFPEGGYSW